MWIRVVPSKGPVKTYLFYDPSLGPQPSEEQPDPQELEGRGDVALMMKEVRRCFSCFFEPKTNRMWAIEFDDSPSAA